MKWILREIERDIQEASRDKEEIGGRSRV